MDIYYEILNGVYVIEKGEDNGMYKNMIFNVLNEIYRNEDTRIKDSPIIFNESSRWFQFYPVWNYNKCVSGEIVPIEKNKKEEAIIEVLKKYT